MIRIAERRAARKDARAEARAVHEDEPVTAPEPAAPVVLPEWKTTTAPKTSDADKTVGDWIIQGVTQIVDEHKLTSLTAWRDPAGNVVVQYIEDPRAMYALRKA